MIQPRFIGRLGNNMFQIAASIGYAKKYNVPWGIKKGYVERGFSANQVDRFFPNLPAINGDFRRHQEHKNNDRCELHNCGRDQCWFNYHPIPFHQNGVEIVGFWQSWKYFEGAEEEIRKVFTLKEYPEYKDYVSIHVRRGDYLQHAHSFPPITVDYIVTSVKLIYEKTIPATVWNQKFIVCSDDIQWCKENLKNGGPAIFEFSEGRNEFEDLSVMASCKHNIISNSTLAWWGAWLNPNPDKMVVSPSCKVGNWFGHGGGVKTDVVDLLPPSWHQIQFR